MTRKQSKKKKTSSKPQNNYVRKIRRNYKDTVFRMLFKDPKELLELYNCVNGSSYTNPGDLVITTLENAIYLNVKNGTQEQPERIEYRLSSSFQKEVAHPELELIVTVLNINSYFPHLNWH